MPELGLYEGLRNDFNIVRNVDGVDLGMTIVTSPPKLNQELDVMDIILVETVPVNSEGLSFEFFINNSSVIA